MYSETHMPTSARGTAPSKSSAWFFFNRNRPTAFAMGFFSMVFPKMDGFPMVFPWFSIVFPWFSHGFPMISHGFCPTKDGLKPVVVDDEPLRQSDGMLQGLQWQQDTDRPPVDAASVKML